MSFLFWGHPLDSPDRWLALRVRTACTSSPPRSGLGGLVGLAVGAPRAARSRPGPPDAADVPGPAPTDPGRGQPSPPTPRSSAALTDAERRRRSSSSCGAPRRSSSRFSTMALRLGDRAVGRRRRAGLDRGRVARRAHQHHLRQARPRQGRHRRGDRRLRRLQPLPPRPRGPRRGAPGRPTWPTTTTSRPSSSGPRWSTTPSSATHARDEARAGLRRLSRTVMVEACSIVVVLALTSVLVNTTPGRSAADDPGRRQPDPAHHDEHAGQHAQPRRRAGQGRRPERHPPELRRPPGSAGRGGRSGEGRVQPAVRRTSARSSATRCPADPATTCSTPPTSPSPACGPSPSSPDSSEFDQQRTAFSVKVR